MLQLYSTPLRLSNPQIQSCLRLKSQMPARLSLLNHKKPTKSLSYNIYVHLSQLKDWILTRKRYALSLIFLLKSSFFSSTLQASPANVTLSTRNSLYIKLETSRLCLDESLNPLFKAEFSTLYRMIDANRGRSLQAPFSTWDILLRQYAAGI